MIISADRSELYRAISTISGVVEKRQTLPILNNVILRATDNKLTITATDLEIQISTKCDLYDASDVEFTVPARKFYDICRTLAEGSRVDISVNNERVTINSGKSKFILSTLPASDYPAIEDVSPLCSFSVNSNDLHKVISKTAFSMAQQDVRYYLNGMLFELNSEFLRCVATDGHRLAMSDTKIKSYSGDNKQIIIPRKAIVELGRILSRDVDLTDIYISEGFVKFVLDDTVFITKIIDGKYPDYQRVIPQNLGISVQLDKQIFKNSLVRTAILSSDKYKGVKITFENGTLKLQAHNPEQEQAEEILDVNYNDEPVNIGFNVNYILDVINIIESEKMNFKFSENRKSALLQDINNPDNVYVVMPMRL